MELITVENIEVNKPYLLAVTEKTIIRGGYNVFSAKVVKTANLETESGAYIEGDVIFTDSNSFIPLTIDDTHFDNTYLINEGTIKGRIK
jgi:hypothetical protein